MYFKKGQTQLINFAKDELWDLNILADILQKTKAYADRKGLQDVTLSSIEDNTDFGDNERYDIMIRYDCSKQGCIYTEQKLLMIRGEVMDCNEYHERYQKKKNSTVRCHLAGEPM